MTSTQITNNLPQFLFFVLLFGILVFVVVAYFAGTGIKESKKKLHQTIFYRWWLIFKEKVLYKLRDKVRKLLKFSHGPLYESVKQVRAALKENVGVKDYLYQIPWYGLIGDADAHPTDILKSMDLSHPIDSPKFDLPKKDPLVSWWFFEKGIVANVAEKCLYATSGNQSKTDWRHFLKALVRYRGKRPLDGLILALPARYFYGANKLAPAELKRRAETLSAQLLQTEKYLGLKLPIYVVLTGCEDISGFKGLCREVLPENQQEMFGWSSAHSTESAYRSHWVKEAFQNIQGFLFEGIMNIFSRGKVEDYGDDLMIFLRELPGVEEGMNLYMDTLFRVKDYRDHFILRGIYLTGKGREASVALEAVDVPGQRTVRKGSLFFLNDLFQRKIFPEQGIALPIKRFIRSANRTITYLKAGILSAAVMGLLSLYLGQRYLTQATGELQPALSRVLHDLQIQGGTNLSEAHMGSHVFETRARTILDLVVKTAHWPLSTTLLVPSLFSDLDDHLYQQIFNIYNMMIANPMHVAFDERADKVMRSPLPHLPPKGKGPHKLIYDPTATPEFMTLAGYVDELTMLEDRATLYNTLKKSKNGSALEKVIRYLYGFAFPKRFVEDDSPFKKKVIGEAYYRPFNLSNYRLFAEKRLYALYNAFLERILDPEYLYRLAEQLQESLEDVDGSGEPDIEAFYKTLVQIKDLIKFISPEGAGWLSKPEFDLGERYQIMMEKIENLHAFGKDVPKKLAKVSETLHEKALHYLKSYGSPLTGYFFETSTATKKLEPSQGLLTLEKGLGLFLHKPFMAKTDGDSFEKTIPDNELLHWDRRLLKNAIALIENYEEFLEEELPGYPADLQDTLRVVALRQTQRNVEAILERAQTFFEVPVHSWGKQAEDAARLQVDNVTHAGPLLLKLLTKLDNIGSTTTFTDLRNLVFAQMFQNLKQLDKVLVEAGYYMPLMNDMSWWKGDKNLLLQAYGMMDKHEMTTFFENQTQHIMHMIQEYAAPVMQVLKADVFTMSVEEVVIFARWNRLLEEAVAYQNKKAGGSLKALETFLVDEGNALTSDDCLKKISYEEAHAKSGDFFLQRRNEIRRRVFEQCQAMSVGYAAAQYNKLATFFNDFMANTFPFIDGVPKGSKIASDVSEKILKEFFGEFDKLTPPMYKAIEKSGIYGDSWKDVKRFLVKMEKVRAFTDKYFAPKVKDGEPGIDFTVEFRQNQMREKHADMVMDWAVVVGEKTSSVREGSQVLRWEFGQNVAIGFQWAMDAPLHPVEDDKIAALVKLGGRSMYVYQGHWALLRMIMLHKAAAQEGGSTRNDTLLKYIIPVGPNPMLEAVDDAKLFIRFVPQTAKGLSDMSFKIPAFPVRAPKLIKESE